MAAHDALEGKPAALDGAILLQGLQGILGARWGVSAGRWCKRTDTQLIELYKHYQRESQYLFYANHCR